MANVLRLVGDAASAEDTVKIVLAAQVSGASLTVEKLSADAELPFGLKKTVFLHAPEAVLFDANVAVCHLLGKEPLDNASRSLIEAEQRLDIDAAFITRLLSIGSSGLTSDAARVIVLGRLYIAEQRSNLKSAPAAVLELYAALKAQFASAMEYYDSNVRSLVQVPAGKVEDFAPNENVRAGVQKVMSSTAQVLPIENERNVLITSALPYVNNVPHLGNIIGSVLSADVYARYSRLRGVNTLYICGTDEYGTATETKALQENTTPREICDRFHAIHKDIYDWFDISFDYFGRTTTEQQTAIAQDIFHKLNERKLLSEESVEQQWCEKDQRFLSDRFVEGECPLCGYNDARGDQCDQCGKLLNAVELKNPRCKICGSAPVVRPSQHMFLHLEKLQDDCEKFFTESSKKGEWSPNGISITRAWFKEGLQSRCITRDLSWGTPVPLPGLEKKVFYVWFDAPIGYISITANYTEQWRKWWKNPEQVQLYQFMGKDNVPFHSVIFPSSLIGTGENYTLLHHLSTTEYLNYEDGKFSKSRGVGVFGNNARDTNIPVSVWRFYLLANRPEGNDSQFSWSDLQLKVNTELLANLGNFVNRSLKFLKSKYGGRIPECELSEADTAFVSKVDELLAEYIAAMDGVQLRDGLRIAMNVSRLGNQLLTDNRLDNALFDNERDRCNAVISLAANLSYVLSALLYPFMPGTTADLLKQLHAPVRLIPERFTLDLLPGHAIGTPAHLFSRIEDKDIQTYRTKFGGQKDAKALSATEAASGSAGKKKQVKKKSEPAKKEQTAEAAAVKEAEPASAVKTEAASA